MTEVMHIDEHVVPGKRLGRHVEHDPLSWDYPFRTAEAVAIQDVSWTKVGRVLNQGDTGACTGFATAGSVNTKPLHGATTASKKTLTNADGLGIYGLATQLDGFPGQYPPDDTGSSGLAACKAAKQKGLITGYAHAFGVAAALQALMHGPVITGVNWYEGFDNPDPSGLVKVAGQVRGGHEFKIYGVALGHDLTAYSDAILLAQNSWGTGWGVSGTFRFSGADWTRLLHERGDCTVPLG